MIRKQDADKHNIHNGRMVGDKDIRCILIFFLFRKFNQIISEAHPVKHAETPEPDKFIAVFIMLFIKG